MLSKGRLYRQQNDNLLTSSIERIVARLKREKEEKEGIKNCRNKFVLLNKTEKLNTPWELAAKTRSSTTTSAIDLDTPDSRVAISLPTKHE